MANMHLVTGYAGKEHIKASDQGAFHAAMFGGDDFVLKAGNQLAASVISNNQVRVFDGDFYMQGRFARLDKGTYVDLTIENGAQGYLRNDLIVARYTENQATAIEEVNLVVIKGEPVTSNPVDPVYTNGNILTEGDTLHDFPLYRVVIVGLNLVELVPLFILHDAEKAQNNGDDVIHLFDASTGIRETLKVKNLRISAEQVNEGAIPIEHGGTGATNLQEAHKNLELEKAVKNYQLLHPNFNRIVFMESTNWTAPDDLANGEVFVMSIGGGGGGGKTGEGEYGGYGGGGGSGYLNIGCVKVQPGSTCPVLVGAGGAVGSVRGGSTSFAGQVVAEGGYSGGAGGDSSSAAAMGSGGNGGNGLAGGGGGGSKYGSLNGTGGTGGNGTLGGGGGGAGAGATYSNGEYLGIGGAGGSGGTYGGGGGGGASGAGGTAEGLPIGGSGGTGGRYGGTGGTGWGGGSKTPATAQPGSAAFFDSLRVFGVNVICNGGGAGGESANEVDSDEVGGAGGGGGASGAGGNGGWSAFQRGGGAGGGGGGITTCGTNPGTGAGGNGGNSTETSNRNGSGGGGGGGGLGCPGGNGGGGTYGGGGGGAGGVRLEDFATDFGQGGNGGCVKGISYPVSGVSGVCVICYYTLGVSSV